MMMDHVFRAVVAACVALFVALITLVTVEDWQAWASENHPEMQWRGNCYTPYNITCSKMLQLLGDPDSAWIKDTIMVDFDTLVSHGYNLIRIYYNPEYEIISPDTCRLRMPDDAMFLGMDNLLTLLDSVGLKLYVSLTGIHCWEEDACCREALLDTTGLYQYRYQAWLDTFLTYTDETHTRAYANDNTILVWDLRNEGGMDDDECNNWARAILPFLQDTLDITTPVTRGLGLTQASQTDIVREIGDFDFYDWHAYVRHDTAIGGDSVVVYCWTALPDSVENARLGSLEHTLSFGEFGYRMDSTNVMSEMEMRQLYRNFFYKMWELGISHGLIWKMYDRLSVGRYPGVYRQDRSFKPAGELIEQVFSGTPWDSIPIIGNWHMELDERRVIP